MYLKPDVTAEQKATIEKDLDENPEVKENGVTFVDQDETFEEFKRLFADQEQLLDTVTADVLPTVVQGRAPGSRTPTSSRRSGTSSRARRASTRSCSPSRW